ncbi:hypothetical protein PS783_21320 [Streptomyces enissocaesilis]|nr:hypothetical protein [Streptomyces sp. RT42]WDI19961.1 hypothetical protein PS783_21320 [Streptomyces enissocaesilis]
MHSEPAFESRAAVGERPPRGRRRTRGHGAGEGPVFVDNSGRRARLLRRLGLLLGAVCVGYAAVLGLAFLGIGTSLNPSSLLPFGGGQDGGGPAPGGGPGPQGGALPTGAPPTGAALTGAPPTGAPPSGAPTAPGPTASSTLTAPSGAPTPTAPATD